MLKRIIQITLIVVAVVAIIYLYFKLSGSDDSYADALDAMPPGMALMLEISDYSALEEYYPVISYLSNGNTESGSISINPASDWHQLVVTIDSLRTANQSWYDALTHSSLLIGCSDQGRSDGWLMAMGLKKNPTGSDALPLMETWIKPSIKRDFKGTTIYTSGAFLWCELNNCLVLSSRGSVIEEAIISSSRKTNIRKNPAFDRLRALASKDIPVHYYAAYDNKSWIQLDPSFVDGKGMLSGYALLSDTTNCPLRMSRSGSEFSIQNHLPSKTVMLDIYAYQDFETGWKIQEDYHAGTTSSLFWSQAWKDLGNTCQCDLNESMLSWRTGEWGTAVIDMGDSATAEINFFGVRDSANVMEKMNALFAPQSTGISGVFHMQYPQLFERNQPQGVLVECNYVTQKGNYVFAAATPGELQYISLLNDTLGQSNSWQKAIAGLKKNTGRFIFQSDQLSSPLPSTFGRMLAHISPIAITSEHTAEDKYLVHISLPLSRQNTSVTSDDTAAADDEKTSLPGMKQGPWTVINHSTNGKEQVYLSKQQELCLIGEDGKLLWKKDFPDNILGDIVQVDALKNGKLQMAFTTDKGLYILDRNGNNLKGFPYLTKTTITSPLHVADYDNTLKYRLLFALEDGAVMNLTTEALQTEGWKYQSENELIRQIDHVRIGNEDVLITISAAGKIGTYKRNGEIKQSIQTKLAEYDGGKCKIIAGSKLGNTRIEYTTTGGAQKSVQLE